MVVGRLLFLTLLVPLRIVEATGRDVNVLDGISFQDSIGRVLQEACRGEFVDDFYNIEVELKEISKSCTEVDFEILGGLLQEFVADVDEMAPQFEGEFMITQMCDAPEEVLDFFERKLLRADHSHRALGRYAIMYLGGGTCRRCKSDNEDRHLVGKVTSNNNEQKETSNSVMTKSSERLLAKQVKTVQDICDLVETAESTQKSTETTFEQAEELFDVAIYTMKVCGEEDLELEEWFNFAEVHLETCETVADNAEKASETFVKMCKDGNKAEEKGEDPSMYLEEAQEVVDVVVNGGRIAEEAKTGLQETTENLVTKCEGIQRANICSMARLSRFGKLEAERAADKIGDLAPKTLELAKDIDDPDLKSSIIEKVNEKEGKIDEYVSSARSGLNVVEANCEIAPELGGVELEETVKETEDAHEEVMKSGKQAKETFFSLKETHIKAKKQLFDADHDAEMEMAFALIADELSDFDGKIAKYNKEIEKLESKLEKTVDETKKKALKEKLEPLKDKMNQLKKEKEKLIWETENPLEWKKDVAHKMFDVEKAESVDEWNEKFEKLVKEYVPYQIFEQYGRPHGCLDKEPGLDVKVIPLESEREMHTPNQCKRT